MRAWACMHAPGRLTSWFLKCKANQEGRTITTEYPDFFIVATYVPNSGDKLQRLDFRTQIWDKRLQEYLLSLEASGKPVSASLPHSLPPSLSFFFPSLLTTSLSSYSASLAARLCLHVLATH
jgi:hypothetical protein